MANRAGAILAVADVDRSVAFYLVEIEQPAGVGLTEPAESGGAGLAGAEAGP